MNNDNSQQKLLEKIQKSQEFSSSSIYGNYLNYLVEASVQGKDLKETTIAIEFLNKDSDFNPSEDTIVRSHTYKLRKKLERYYFTEGKDDKYRFHIPKGHYEIQFSKIDQKSFIPSNSLTLIQKKFLYVLLAVMFGSTIYLIFENVALKNKINSYKTVPYEDFVWKEIIKSELPTLVAPGDHFIFNMHSDELKKEIGVRDMTINSEENLDNLNISLPGLEAYRSPEPYFPYHSIWTLPPVLSILYSYNKKVIMRKSSIITPQMLDEYNIIFVGSIKTLYTLKHVVSRTHFDFNISPHEILYNDPDSNITKTYTTSLHSSGPNEDLVLALKIRGPVNNSILIVASFHSLGAPEIANYLTNPQQNEELKKLLEADEQHPAQYFEILFKVTGIDKTAYKTEILEYNISGSNEINKEHSE